MPLILDITKNTPAPSELASTLRDHLVASYNTYFRVTKELEEPRYDVLYNLPTRNVGLQRVRQLVLNSGYANRVASKLQDRLPGDPTMAEANAFVNAFNDLADWVKANDSLFVVTHNPQSDRPEFVTPLSAADTAQLQSLLDAIGATLG